LGGFGFYLLKGLERLKLWRVKVAVVKV